MLEQILRWVALALAGILERFGDPQLEARLAAYKAKVAEAEAKEQEAEKLGLQSRANYEKSLADRQAWDQLLAESKKNEALLEAQLRESQDRAIELRKKADKAKADIDALSDGELLRKPL